MVEVFDVVKSVGVDTSELIEYNDIVGTIEHINDEKSTTNVEDKIGEGVLLFFSFDIVNSAQYKTISNLGWSTVIHGILYKVRKTVTGKIKNAEVWRVLGDEVIFIVQIGDEESIFECIEKIYDILTFFCDQIEEGDAKELFDDISIEAIELSRAKRIVSLQATAWVAAVAKKEEIERNEDYSIENIFEVIDDNPEIKFFEFIGSDIDAGFRISKYTRARRLVISFELACLMMHRKPYEDRMHIITYSKLKGVWNDRLYPIIWYYDETKNMKNGKIISFQESIPFDAKEIDDIYKDLREENRPFEGYLYDDISKALTKVALDRGLEGKIEKIERIIKSDKKIVSNFFSNTRMELHCVAVCFNPKGEILIAKRNDRKLQPGKWEFGCAKANYKEPLIKTIKREYKDDFGIDIELEIDDLRNDSQPKPLAIYSISKDKEMHKGIIFIAKILSGEICVNPDKHSEYRYISEDQVSSLNEDDFVPDGIDTINKAFDYWRKNYDK